MNDRSSNGKTPMTSVNAIAPIVNAFLASWQAGTEMRAEEFVVQCSTEHRPALLLELLAIEIRYRRAAGDALTMTELTDRFPADADLLQHRFAALVGSVERSQSSTVTPTIAWDPNAKPVLTHAYAGQHITGSLLGRYALTQRIGKGSFGEVWRAHDPKLSRTVAVKAPRAGLALDPIVRDQFVAEGRKAGQLDHPNIVTVYDAGEDESGQCYIVSQFVEGGTLRDRIRNGRLSIGEAVDCTRKLAIALHYAHQRGIVHRDMKPANVLLTGDGKPLITDFGLAKFESADYSILIDGQFAGTPAYMSPEQALDGAHNVDAQTDVFSLGVMLSEMLTGIKPIVGSSPQQLRKYHQQTTPLSLPSEERADVPEEVDRIFAKATNRNPTIRYASAQELADDLEVFQTRMDSSNVGPVDPEPRPRRVTKVLASGIIGLFLLIALLAAVSRNQPVATLPVDDGRVAVRVLTEPQGADVTYIPLTSDTGVPQPEYAVKADNEIEAQGAELRGLVAGADPAADEPADPAQPGQTVATARLRPGTYLVVTVWDTNTFHEVYRTVPTPDATSTGGAYKHMFWRRYADGTVRLPSVELSGGRTSGVTAIERHAFDADPAFVVSGAGRTVEYSIPAFELSTHKLNWNGLRTVIGTAGDDGIAVRGSRIPVGLKSRPELLRQIQENKFPLVAVSWNETMQLAEHAGLRLPEELELESAARQQLQLPEAERVIHDFTTEPAEWTVNRAVSQPAPLFPVTPTNTAFVMSSQFDRVYRKPAVIIASATTANHEVSVMMDRGFLDRRLDNRIDIGVRFAKSIRPRLKPDDFVRLVSEPAETLDSNGNPAI